MRLLFASLLLLLLVPAASAGQELPVVVVAEPTLPSEECPDCVGATAGAGVFIPGCFDCPAYGAVASADHEEGETTVASRVCYSSFIVICLVDEEITV